MQIRELRNKSEISELVHNEQGAIMSVEMHEKFAQVNRIDQAIYEAEKEVEDGAEPISVDSAIDRLNKRKGL